MKYWISQPGYPLIKVEKISNKIKLSQNRYNKDTNQIWPIPVSICTEDICYYELLEKKENTYEIKENAIKLNHKQLGFYRTKYSKELTLNIGYMIKEKRLDESNRWGVQNDLWALCSINEESLENYLLFLDNYLDETSYIILSEIYSSIRKLDRLYYYETWWPKIRDKLTNSLIPTYKNNIKRLGWDKRPNENTEDPLMRNLCISFCGFANDPETIKKIKEIYSKKNVELDIANSIYYIIARNGDENTFKEMLNKYEKSTDTEGTIKLLVGLYNFTNPQVFKKVMDLSLTDKVRTQNLRYVFQNVLGNPNSQKEMLNWVKSNWTILEKHKEKHHIFKDFLEALIISQVTKKAKEEVKEFIDKNKIAYEMTKANSFEILDQNLQFIEKNKDFLKNY